MDKILIIITIVVIGLFLGFTYQQIAGFFSLIFYWVGWLFSKLSWLLGLAT